MSTRESDSLREALEALASDYATIDAEQITELLAAHPVEPAPTDYSQEEIAAKIADRVPHTDLDGFSLSERLRIGKAVAPLVMSLIAPGQVAFAVERQSIHVAFDGKPLRQPNPDLIDLARLINGTA